MRRAPLLPQDGGACPVVVHFSVRLYADRDCEECARVAAARRQGLEWRGVFGYDGVGWPGGTAGPIFFGFLPKAAPGCCTGVNDDDANLAAAGEFVSSLKGVAPIDVLPYNGGERAKSARLAGGPQPMEVRPPGAERMKAIAGTPAQLGFTVRIGG